MLFLSFLASLSLLASSRPICLFVGPVIHYSCRLGLMVFCYLFCQFFVALIIGLSFCLPGFSQMALNNVQSISTTLLFNNQLLNCWPLYPNLKCDIHCPWDAISFFPGFFEPACLFKTHLFICWACDPLFLPLGPNGFLLSIFQFFVALIIGLSFCLPGFSQMTLNNVQSISTTLLFNNQLLNCWPLYPNLKCEYFYSWWI